jgi:hypothetical protein
MVFQPVSRSHSHYAAYASGPQLPPPVILSEVIVRNADDHAVEGPLPTQHCPTASRRSPSNAASFPVRRPSHVVILSEAKDLCNLPGGTRPPPQAPTVWDGHSCPSPLIFSVTLCLRGEWFSDPADPYKTAGEHRGRARLQPCRSAWLDIKKRLCGSVVFRPLTTLQIRHPERSEEPALSLSKGPMQLARSHRTAARAPPRVGRTLLSVAFDLLRDSVSLW